MLRLFVIAVTILMIAKAPADMASILVYRDYMLAALWTALLAPWVVRNLED